jgi:hypothetical protein
MKFYSSDISGGNSNIKSTSTSTSNTKNNKYFHQTGLPLFPIKMTRKNKKKSLNI